MFIFRYLEFYLLWSAMMEKKRAWGCAFESAEHVSGLHGGKDEFPGENAEGTELWPLVTLKGKRQEMKSTTEDGKVREERGERERVLF